MKRNKKNGFTLVELLAVIVILAIILVIAVPQIMSTIKDTTKASLESSAKMVAAQVEKQYTVAQTLGKEFGETGSCMQDWAGLNDVDYASCTYEITSNGTAKITLVGKGKFKNLSVCSGTRSNASATEGDACLPKTLSKVAVTSTDLGVTSIHSCATSGTCEPGTSFAIKVSDTETYKFYVISDDGNEVALIMNENLGEPVRWITQEDYDEANIEVNTQCDTYYDYEVCSDKGPLTALKELNNRTKDWNNLDLFDYTLTIDTDDFIFQPVEVKNVKARLVTKSEVEKFIDLGLFKDYMYPGSEWYWVSSASKQACPEFVRYDGVDNIDGADQCVSDESLGLRPVVVIQK